MAIEITHDTPDAASLALLNSLTSKGKDYDAPIFKLYATTLSLLLIIHAVFIYQIIKKSTRDEVSTSFRRIVIKKQFHRAVLALISHPPISNARLVLSAPEDDQSPVEVEMGNTSPGQRPIENLFGRFISGKLKAFVNPFINGKFSGLPLLAYLCHCIWQCRPLEEIYDYGYDRLQGSHHPTFNMTTIIEADTILQKYFQTKTSHGNTSKEDLSFLYYRVLLVLALTALSTHLLLTKLLVTMLRNRTSGHAFLDRLMDRDYATLTSLATALVILYTAHFPYTSISVLPGMDTSIMWVSWSSVGFILTYGILTLLSFRTRNITSVFHGSLSALLFLNGWSTFLATRYWGNWLVILGGFVCALSIKAEYQSTRQQGHYRTAIDWLPCIDSVLWNENGVLNDFSAMDTIMTYHRE